MRKKIAKFLELWPVYLLAGVYYVSYFNPDYVIAPLLLVRGYSKLSTLLVVGGIGFLEMFGGYKGWSGVRGLIEKWLRDDIEFVKRLKGEKETRNYTEWLKVKITRKYLKLTDNSQYYKEPVPKTWLFRNIDEVFKWILIVLKGGGVVAMFIFGLIPVPGFRMIPDFLCGVARLKVGFAALSLGNFLKTIGMVYGFWGQVL
ncbi:MAG: hypothetical protein WD989_01760 [Candidatus Paceibacterota bacterium]